MKYTDRSQVLQKFLKKVEIEVETVLDGVECTDAVFTHDHGYYSIILVSVNTSDL